MPSQQDVKHPYIAPQLGDHRSPCPALNTMANQGYLPRHGQDISAWQFTRALQTCYNLSLPLAIVLAYGGFILLHRFPWPWTTISLKELARHGYIEHNASLVHRDAAPGEIYAPIHCVPALVDDLCAEVTGFTELTTPTIIDDNKNEKIGHPSPPLANAKCIGYLRHIRERVSLPLDAVHAEIARGEMAIVLGVFSEHPRSPFPSISSRRFMRWLAIMALALVGFNMPLERWNNEEQRRALLSTVPADSEEGVPLPHLRTFLLDERLPEGWKPARTVGLFETVYRSSLIRHAQESLGIISPSRLSSPSSSPSVEDTIPDVTLEDASSESSFTLSGSDGGALHSRSNSGQWLSEAVTRSGSVEPEPKVFVHEAFAHGPIPITASS